MKTLEFSFTDSLIDNSIIENGYKELDTYRKHLAHIIQESDYTSPEASLCVPGDNAHTQQVRNILENTDISQLRYIFVVGIGGSNLGTKAIYDALRGTDDAHRKQGPKMIFVDTVGEKLFEIIDAIISESITKPEEILINIISKSGGTAETIFNAEVLIQKLQHAQLSNIKDRIIITTNHKSALYNTAEEEGLSVLTLPAMVGGRYSVFTTVGLLPLMAAGFDVNQLLAGAKEAVKVGTQDANNNALVSAIVSAESLKQNVLINNTFVFNPELESIGKWYRQLMGESIGKRYNQKREEIRTGIVPMVSVGSTDLHSMAQLYFGGPRIILHNFIYADTDTALEMPHQRTLPGLVPAIEGVSNIQLMKAIIGGTQETLKNNKVPFIDIKMEKIDEYNLGAYLQFRMIEMMYLAKLMNVNAFDQPSVEEYKTETKNILSS